MMSRTARLLGIALVIALAMAQVPQAMAAPLAGPLIGTIDSITVDTSVSPNVVVVKYTDEDGLHHTIELSLADAETLGLVSVDGVTGEVTILGVPGQSIDLTGITFVEVDPCAGGSQPVASALCNFFGLTLGVDYALIDGWHADGYGFGVIAQALFMAQVLGGDMTLAGEILAAKTSGDYSNLGLPPDVVITNWGQFKKYVLQDEAKSLTNLGAIMSGRVQPPTTLTTTTTLSTTTQTGNGHGHRGEHGKSGEHGKGKGH